MEEKNLFNNLVGIRELVEKHTGFDIKEADGNEAVFRAILDALSRLDGIVDAYRVRSKHEEEMKSKGWKVKSPLKGMER